MLGQTTDSGSSNNTMAREMEVMFSESDDPAEWDASKYHVRCYAHKLGLIVKKGLKVIGLAAGHIKPTTPPHFSVPVPTVVLNDDLTEEAITYDCSDDEDDIVKPRAHGDSPMPGSDDEEEDLSYDDIPQDGCIVVKGAMKVSFSFLLSPLPLHPLSVGIELI